MAKINGKKSKKWLKSKQDRVKKVQTHKTSIKDLQ